MKKILAIDFGRKKIGLAIADLETKIPLPREGFFCKNEKEFLEIIKKIVETENIGLIVLGLPLSLDFKETDLVLEIKKLGEFLEKKLGIPVDYENEIFSSEEAESYYRFFQRKIRGKIKKRKNLDSLAAAIILESYLKKKFKS